MAMMKLPSVGCSQTTLLRERRKKRRATLFIVDYEESNCVHKFTEHTSSRGDDLLGTELVHITRGMSCGVSNGAFQMETFNEFIEFIELIRQHYGMNLAV